MSTGNSPTPDLLDTIRRELAATATRILSAAEVLQEQAEEAGQEAFLADLHKIHGAGKHLVQIIHELVGDHATLGEDVDLPRLRFEIRGALNHTVGYIEMLQERAQELEQCEFLPALEKVHAACWQLLEETEAAARPAGIRSAADVYASRELPPPDDGTVTNGTMLVVDDNIQIRHYFAQQLRLQGYRVVHAGSGPAAMERLRGEKIELVLLDVVMPGMNGYEVLQWLKADPELRHIPVLMTAALNDTENVVRCLVIGADDYVAKPCDPILLKIRVSHCLERHRWRRREALGTNS